MDLDRDVLVHDCLRERKCNNNRHCLPDRDQHYLLDIDNCIYACAFRHCYRDNNGDCGDRDSGICYRDRKRDRNRRRGCGGNRTVDGKWNRDCHGASEHGRNRNSDGLGEHAGQWDWHSYGNHIGDRDRDAIDLHLDDDHHHHHHLGHGDGHLFADPDPHGFDLRLFGEYRPQSL